MSEFFGAYDEGTVTTGKLDPRFKTGTLSDRLKAIDAEIPDHPYLVCAYFAQDAPASLTDYVAEPLLAREGATAIEVRETDSLITNNLSRFVPT